MEHTTIRPLLSKWSWDDLVTKTPQELAMLGLWYSNASKPALVGEEYRKTFKTPKLNAARRRKMLR